MSAIVQAESALPRLIAGLSEVFSSYASLKRKRAQCASLVITDVLDQWLSTKRKLAETNRDFSLLFKPFNLFPIGETSHSRVLGELLNPQGGHGQGNLFLVSFLNMLGVPEPNRGKWAVTVERWHVDILLRRREPASVIIIENKSNHAADQSNQLYRYWHQQIHKRYPALDYSNPETKASFKVVYLPPDSSKKPAVDSLIRPRQWDEVDDLRNYPRLPLDVVDTICFCPGLTEWLARVSSSLPVTNVRLKVFLEFYAEIWR